MNIERGFDRIALVLALISLVIGFFIGGEKYNSLYSQTRVKVIPERRVDKELGEKHHSEKFSDIKISPEKIIQWNIQPPPKGYSIFPVVSYSAGKPEDAVIKELIFATPPYYPFIAAILSSIGAFLFVWLGIKGLVRLFIWVVDGFKA